MIFTELLSVLSVGQSHKYHTYLMPQLTRRLLWGNSPNECLFNFFPPLFTFNTVIKCHCLSGSFGGYFFLFYNSERAFYCLAHQAVRDDWKSSLWSISLTEVWPFSITNLNLLHWELKSWEMSAAMQLQVLCTLSFAQLTSWRVRIHAENCIFYVALTPSGCNMYANSAASEHSCHWFGAYSKWLKIK